MKPRYAVGGLIALLVLDVTLVALSLESGRPAANAATPRASASADATPAPRPTGGNATSSTPTSAKATSAQASYRPAPLTVMIVAVDSTLAWRATAGQCKSGGGTVETTSDGGATWEAMPSPARAIARIQPVSATEGFAVAAGKDCVLRRFLTNDGAGSWQGPQPVDGSWARQISDSRAVLTPERPDSRPCGKDAVVDLARTGSSEAAALCLNGDIKRSTNGGASWSNTGRAPGALSLATRLTGNDPVIYAARVIATCPGIEIVEVPGQDADPKRIGCLSSSGPAAAGAVSLSTPSNAGWLTVGEQTWVAGANLKKWTKV